jgi:deoxyribodipyrimidine photolyase-related protein
MLLLFPHQLFAQVLDETHSEVTLHKHPLFFTQYNFHPEKVALHKESMAWFGEQLKARNISVTQTDKPLGDIAKELRMRGITAVSHYELCDDYLTRDVKKAFAGFTVTCLPSPMFLTPYELRERYFANKKHVSMRDFYLLQRKRLGILLEADGTPMGGQWSFDAENRKPIPKGVMPPRGSLVYPRTHTEAQAQLSWFLENCLADFGPYEDAMRGTDGRLFHSVLTPALNIGLITPAEIIEQTLAFAQVHAVPIASLEGFLRQVIGWREFVCGTYETLGRKQRTTNFLGFTNTLPEAFWTGTTGLLPADTVIKRVNETGYCHHIERLMVLGNLLLLLEVHPDHVYEWFMTQFIDAYDWVMVPNVYGMSQYADGGLMTTKPYICGSAYLLKMGDWGAEKKGEWTAEWDALYWRFIHRHRKIFLANHRSSMMVHLFDKLKDETKSAHFEKIKTIEQRLGVTLPTEPK